MTSVNELVERNWGAQIPETTFIQLFMKYFVFKDKKAKACPNLSASDLHRVWGKSRKNYLSSNIGEKNPSSKQNIKIR